MKRFFFFVLLIFLGASLAVSAKEPVRITYLGHACFLIQSPQGVRVLTDPYGQGVGYPARRVQADLVAISHEHFDHNNAAMAKDPFLVLRGVKPDGGWNLMDTRLKDVEIKSVFTYHDNNLGRERGKNTCIKMKVGDFTIVHLGDLGDTLNDEDKIKSFGKVDILLIPVGGTYTIGPEEADEVIKKLKPKVIIPMHYKTRYTSPKLPLKPVSEFLKGKSNVKIMDGSTLEISELPKEQTIIVLKPLP